MTSIGSFLKEARQKAGLTQTELGKKLGYTSGQYISNVERGRCPFTPKRAKKAAKILRIQENTLVQHMIVDFLKRFGR